MGIVTVTKLENADKDVDSLNTFINGADTAKVKTRTNKEYPTLANAVRQVIETGGWEPFATETALLASKPIAVKKAAKALDTRKVWLWERTSVEGVSPVTGNWTDTGLSEKDLAIAHSDAEIAKTEKSLVNILELNKVPFSPKNKNIFEIYNNEKLALSIDEKNVVAGNFDFSEIEIDTSLDMIVPHNPTNEEQYEYEIKVGNQTIIKLDKDKKPIFLGNDNDDPDPEPDETNLLQQDTWFSDNDVTFFVNATESKIVLNEKSFNPQFLNDKCAVAAVKRNWVTDGYHQAIITKAGSVYPNPEKTLLIIPVLGQSLGFGYAGLPSLTLTNDYPEYALKFKNTTVQLGLSGDSGVVGVLDPSKLTDFDAIVAKDNSNGSGENIGVTVAQQLAKQFDDEADTPMRVMSFTTAVNGTAYSGIKKGTQAYTNFITAVTQAVNIAKAKGWTVIMPAFIMQHGEANRSTSVATYKADLNEYITDINADVKVITGQTADIYMYYSNPCVGESSTSGNSNQAMYELGKENPLAVHSHSVFPAQPIATLNDLNAEGDVTHLTASGYIYMGYKYVQAIKHDLKHGMGSFKGVYPLSVTRTDNLIDIRFNVPKPPLVYKTSDYVRAHDTWGLSFSDSTNSAAIQSVEIISDDTVRVTLSNIPTGTNMQIKGGHILRTDSTLATRPRINIADSTEGQTPYGDSLAHWAIAFIESVI